jgi:hypothetical protein
MQLLRKRDLPKYMERKVLLRKRKLRRKGHDG